MSQKRSVNDFEWKENIHKFDEDFIKIYDENSNEVDVEYSKTIFNGIAYNLHSDLPFLPERNKIKKCNKLVYNFHDRKTMLFTSEL